MLENLLSKLGLDQNEVLTYTTLLELGPTTAGSLAKSTGLIRVSQYALLKRTVEKGFVIESQKNGLKLFSAIDPERLGAKYEETIGSMQEDYDSYKKILPTLLAKHVDRLLIPKIQIFEGKEGLKNVLKDMLLYRNIETQAYWPIKKMVDMLSSDFFRLHNKERIKNNLYTRAIWPVNQVVKMKDHPYLGAGKEFKREIRIAPKEIDFSMGYWIYGNKVAFLSSRKESFGYVIESKELAEMLLSQFEVVWKLSKPLLIKPAEVKEFLKEI